MAISKFNITKIEVGVQYAQASDSSDVAAGFTYGESSSKLYYYENSSSATSTSSPAWIKNIPSNRSDFDYGQIALGVDNGSLKGVTPYLSNYRKAYEAKQTYYDGSTYKDVTIAINADDAGITSNIKYYPFVDITYSLTSGTGAMNNEAEHLWSFREVSESSTSSSTRYEAAAGNPYNMPGYYFSPDTTQMDITNSSLNSNYYICTYDTSNNANWFKFKAATGASTYLNTGDFGNIFGISNLGAYLSGEEISLSDIFAFGYTNGTNTASRSFQGIHYITSSTGDFTTKVDEVTIRCYVGQNYGVIKLPSQSFTEQTETSTSFNIALCSIVSNVTSTSFSEAKKVTFILRRNIAPAVETLKHEISLESGIKDFFNKVKLRNLKQSSIIDFTLKDIAQDLYVNYITKQSEKDTDKFIPNLKYGSVLANIYDDSNTDIQSVYKYYLYLKLNTSDINDIEMLKLKLFPTLTVNVSNAEDFKKDSIHITYYYAPNASTKLAKNTKILPGVYTTPAAVVVTDEMWAYPIGELAVIGNSANYMNILYDLSDTEIWKDLIDNHTNLYHELTTDETGYSFLDALDEIYDSSEINKLCNEFVNAIKSNDNILGTNIPMIINVKYTSLDEKEHSINYLINMIIDFKDIRESLNSNAKYEFRLLKDSGFLRNGFWRNNNLSDTTKTLLYPFSLDTAADSNIEDKIMSPIDVINRSLYVFGTNIKEIEIEDESKVFPEYLNDYIVYADMLNMTNADTSSTIFKSAYFGDSAIGILDTANRDGFLENDTEYNYLLTKTPGTSFFRSIFDDRCPTNSYDTFMNSFKSNSSKISLDNKGFSCAAIGYIDKDSNVAVQDGNAEPLLMPLHKFEDIFLTHFDPMTDRLICTFNNDKLNSEIIISVK